MLCVRDRPVGVAAAEPEHRPDGIDLAGQVVRRSRLDLAQERIRPDDRLVPTPELVLLVDEDAAEPANEIRLAVPLRLLARVDPELPGLTETAARPVHGGQVSHRPALLEVSIGRACDVDRLGDLVQSSLSVARPAS